MRSCLFAAASLFAASLAAHANPVDTFTFTAYGDTTVATLDASPVVTSSTATSFTTVVTAIWEGKSYTYPVTFYTTAANGGGSGDGAFFSGDQLFSGSVTDPTFTPRTYDLSGFADLGFGPIHGTAQLTITANTVTPEPASIALLGTGLLGFAGTLRRRVLP